MRVAILLAAGLLAAGCAASPHHVSATRPVGHGATTALPTSGPLPGLRIPAGLFRPADGSRNFDRVGTTALAHRGDWYLAQTSMECVLPIPAGWYTNDTGQETDIFFSESKPSVPLAQKVLSVAIRVHFDGSAGDKRTAARLLAGFKSAAAQAGLTLLSAHVVDAHRSYGFFSGRSASGKTRYQVIVFSKNRAGLFYVFSADTYASEWDRYYPLLRAMMNGWFDLDGQPLGMPLPDRISG